MSVKQTMICLSCEQLTHLPTISRDSTFLSLARTPNFLLSKEIFHPFSSQKFYGPGLIMFQSAAAGLCQAYGLGYVLSFFVVGKHVFFPLKQLYLNLC